MEDDLDELGLEVELGEEPLPKWRRLDVSLPPSWEPSPEEVLEKSREVAVLDNRAVEESGLPVFDVHLYVLTIACLQIEKLVLQESKAETA